MVHIDRYSLSTYQVLVLVIYCYIYIAIFLAPNSKPYFKNIEYAQKAASILGCKVEEIARIVFATPLLSSRNSMRRSSRSGSILSRSNSTTSQTSIHRLKSSDEKLLRNVEEEETKSNDTTPSSAASKIRSTDPSMSSQILVDNVYEVCVHALEGLLTGLYVEAFTAVLRLVNRTLQTTSRIATTMSVLDGPGFQNKTIIGLPGSYEDLTKNYCREKTQWFMHHCSFTANMDRYNRVSFTFRICCKLFFSLDLWQKVY